MANSISLSEEQIKKSAEMLTKLTTRLLDISAKNKFLNFKNPFDDNSQSIAFKDDTISAMFDNFEKQEPVIIPFDKFSEFFVTDASSVQSKFSRFKRASTTSMEETGSNCLFLAYSFIRYRDEDKKMFWAPLYLVPVFMEIDEEGVTLLHTGAPPLSNYALIEKIKKTCELPPIEDDTPEEYFNRISALIPPSWMVDKTNCLVKINALNMLLFNDVSKLAQNESILKNKPALTDFLAEESLLSNRTSDLSSVVFDYTSDTYPHIVTEADSSQMQVIYRAVNTEDSFVVEGPPGTGKSQTITNIISSLISSGKKVLFVSEKLAALEVVKSRLESAKLGPFLFSLHNPKVNKKEVIKQLFEKKEYPKLAMPDALNKVEGLKKKIQKSISYFNNHLDSESNLSLIELSAKKYYENNYAPVEASSVTYDLDFEQWSNRYMACLNALNGYSPGDSGWVFESISYFDTSEFLTDIKHIQQQLEAKQFVAECGLSYIKENNIDIESFINLAKIALPLLVKYKGVEPLQTYLYEKTSLSEYLASLDTPDFTDEDMDQLDQLESDIFGLGDYFVESAYIACHPISAIDETKPKDISLQEYTLLLRTFLDCFAQLPKSFYTSLGFKDEVPIRVLEEIVEILEWVKLKPADAIIDLRLNNFIVNDSLKSLIFQNLKIQQDKSVLSKFFDENKLDQGLPAEDILFCKKMIDRFKRKGPIVTAILQLLYWNDVKQFNSGFHYFYTGPYTEVQALNTRIGLMEPVLNYMQNKEEFSKKLDAIPELRAYKVDQFELLLESSDWLLAFPKNVLKLEEILSHNELFNPVFSAAIPALYKNVQQLRIEHFSLNHLFNAIPQYTSDLENLESFLDENPNFYQKSIFELFRAISLKNAQLTLAHKRRPKKNCPACMDSFEIPQLIELQADLHILSKANPNNWSLEAVEDIRNDISYYEVYSNKSKQTLLLECFEKHGITLKDFALKALEEPYPASEYTPDYADYLLQFCTENGSSLIAWKDYMEVLNEGVLHGYSSFIAYCEKDFSNANNLLSVIRSKSETSYLLKELSSMPCPDAPSEQEIAEYNKFDSLVIARRGYVIGRALSDNTPVFEGAISARVKEYTEQQLLNHLEKSPGARIPLRSILANARNSILAQKPCFMMGPQAIAQFLDPSLYEFDVVIIDEASQMKLEHSLTALARGKRYIIVGDPKQLSPTNQNIVDLDEDDQDYLLQEESVLTWALQKYSTYSLKWHYRSLHPSLIEFSNKYFYDQSLIVFPCATSLKGGFFYNPIFGGFLDKSVNQKEATSVAEKCIQLMENFPQKSIGIISATQAQADYIEMLVKSARFTSIPVRDYLRTWSSEGSRFFVKTLENVQGDERDIILVSLTYGPTFGEADVKQSFGALSKEEGWKRLNVLLSRAKEQLFVFSSLKASDIGESNTKGMRLLQLFLDYAERSVSQANAQYYQEELSLFTSSNYLEYILAKIVYDLGLNFIPYVENNLPCKLYLIADSHKYLAVIEGPAFDTSIELRDTSRVMQSLFKARGWEHQYKINGYLWATATEQAIAEFREFLSGIQKTSVELSALPISREIAGETIDA